MEPRKVFRASILHSLSETSYTYFKDGLLVLEGQYIKAVGPASELVATLPEGTIVHDYPNSLIIPGFIDAHIHYPQTGVTASYGTRLLDWLNTYTFPRERQFVNKAFAKQEAEIFLKELLRNGTTTALVMCTVHKQSVDAFFESAEKLNLRMIAGKVLMDRNAPMDLLDTAESGYEDSKELIERWHGKKRLLYAVTPRFAITSSAAQLTKAGQLLTEYPGLYMHTHLSESSEEVAFVQELFPASTGDLDVHHQFHLTGKRSVFAHAIYLSEGECKLLAETGSSVVFCPTSNLFTGAGLFNLTLMEKCNVKVGLGTDIGGGTSFSQLRTLSEAYKVLQMQKENLSPMKSLYLATLGGAKALDLDDKLGNFLPGKEADFTVLDLTATPLLTYRLGLANSIEEKLFALITLGDDRVVLETYAAGELVHSRD